VVTRLGNQHAQHFIDQVYEGCDQQWRGIGLIPMSGWRLRKEYSQFDASNKFELESIHTHESEECIAGLILQGLKKPKDCPVFAKNCTPENPLGATMVSSEGTCSAYYRYARNRE
jgi:hydrogenase expression/formation protein HypD